METLNQNSEIAWRFPIANMSLRQRIILSIVCIAGIAGTLLWDRNLIFIAVLTLFLVVIWLQSFVPQRISEIKISEGTISVGGVVYLKKDIKSFWLEYDPRIGAKELSLEIDKWYLPYLKIPLLKQNPIVIRSILVKSWPEKEHPISWLDILSRRSGLSKTQK